MQTEKGKLKSEGNITRSKIDVKNSVIGDYAKVNEGGSIFISGFQRIN